MELSVLVFRPGLGVQEAIKQRFGLPVSPAAGSLRPFFLVASFGRCKFHLCNLSVGLILQATIGGAASDFNVVQLSSRVFPFSVSSKAWVFMCLS
jgi:hypothetical protein